MRRTIAILGVFNADTTYRADRLPRIGETILGNAFHLGPGGKGSNQAVAAARAGGRTHFITKLGTDPFGDMALSIWAEAGVVPEVTRPPGSQTGAAFIYVEEATGDNSIIICPGVAGTLSPADMEAHAGLLSEAAVFVTQLEQPIEAARRGLELARAGGAVTVLNPAPAADLPDGMLALCDYVTPNETEAETLTGIAVTSTDSAVAAAEALVARGAGAVVVTLGEKGALLYDGGRAVLVPALSVGPVVETTGAGDCFNGVFAAGLAEGMTPEDAVRLGCAAAALSVTRAGAAASMPTRDEIDELLKKSR